MRVWASFVFILSHQSEKSSHFMLLCYSMKLTFKTGKGILLPKLQVISLYINQRGFFPNFLSLFYKEIKTTSDALNNKMKDPNLVVISENPEKVSNTTAVLFSELLKIAIVYFQIPALLNTPWYFFSLRFSFST